MLRERGLDRRPIVERGQPALEDRRDLPEVAHQTGRGSFADRLELVGQQERHALCPHLAGRRHDVRRDPVDAPPDFVRRSGQDVDQLLHDGLLFLFTPARRAGRS